MSNHLISHGVAPPPLQSIDVILVRWHAFKIATLLKTGGSMNLVNRKKASIVPVSVTSVVSSEGQQDDAWNEDLLEVPI